MEGEENGWPLIRRCLKQRGWLQRQLAQLLGVTSSAITQAKQGKILFHADQLSKIAAALRMQPEEKEAFYRMIFEKRLLDRTGPRIAFTPEEAERVPLLRPDVLERYEPALESPYDYAVRRAGSFLRLPEAGMTVAVNLPVLPPGWQTALRGRLLLRGETGVRDGDLVLVRLETGPVFDAVCRRTDRGFVLKRSGGMPIIWSESPRDRSILRWMLAIQEVCPF